MPLARHSTLKVISPPFSNLSCNRQGQASPLHAINNTRTSPFALNNCQFADRATILRPAPRRQHQQLISRFGLTCAAGRQAPSDATEASMLPDSREEAISQACAAIAASLPSIKSQKSKKKISPASAPGFAGETKKLSVEIPVADESLDASMSLAKDVVSGLPSPWPKQFTYVVSNTSSGQNATENVVSLDACLQDESDSLLGSCIIIVAPKIINVAAVEQLLGRWRGSVCILLNAEWAPLAAEDDLGDIDSVHTAFVRSFKVVYCFMPLLIKAFVVSTQEGAVFRCVGCNKKSGFSSGGGGEGREVTGDPWRIFMRQNDIWEPVARMQRRPSSTDRKSVV